jgi:hypothetical protein
VVIDAFRTDDIGLVGAIHIFSSLLWWCPLHFREIIEFVGPQILEELSANEGNESLI